jgi:RNA polymerase sigma-70 factor, ECF subfamily
MPITVESTAVSDKSAGIEGIFIAHHERVFRAAYRVTGNASDAEDVLQTVFLRLLRHDHDFGKVDEAGNYLYRAGINAALDIVRSRRSAVPIDEVDHSALPNSSWTPDRIQGSTEIREWLRGAVGRLHPTAAEMFILRYFEDYDNAEVARLMDTTENTVAVTLHRARTRLQQDIRSQLGEVR